MKVPRVVLDTNCVVSALVFPAGRFVWLRQAWQSGRFTPLASRQTVAELLRVLAYPKFRLSADDQAALVADYLPWVQAVQAAQEVGASSLGLPPVRDANDVMFLALAKAGSAQALVTGDADLLAVRDQFEVPILTMAEFEAWLPQGSGRVYD